MRNASIAPTTLNPVEISPPVSPSDDPLDGLDDLREERLERRLEVSRQPDADRRQDVVERVHHLDEEVRERGDEGGQLADQRPGDEDHEQDGEQDRHREDQQDRHASVQPASCHRLDCRIDGDHVERPDHERPELGRGDDQQHERDRARDQQDQRPGGQDRRARVGAGCASAAGRASAGSVGVAPVRSGLPSIPAMAPPLRPRLALWSPRWPPR